MAGIHEGNSTFDGRTSSYLSAFHQMDHGEQLLRLEHLIEDDLFVTGTLVPKAAYNFSQMQEILLMSAAKKWPLMCMEFWDGWFNRWKEPIIKREPEASRSCPRGLEQGSINSTHVPRRNQLWFL